MTVDAAPLSVMVLISGTGSNLQALIDASARRGYVVHAVISNRPQAAGLARAAEAGIATRVVDHTAFSDRDTFDAALAEAIDAYAPDLVVLAGFMRILTAGFVTRYAGRMINVHPSLLPQFQGLNTHRRALEAGVSEHGASVHYVTTELDGGPVIAQTRVAVEPADDDTRLAARVLEREHILLPQVVEWFAEHRLAMREGQVWFDNTPLPQPLQC